ncbi:unnamed protein product [Urochloa decumbens]|uniref:MATH domain-containing protein n=1 Tax=Urochloa decumbens TaxID=240449 RepID=A0ABC9AEY6_9POAL
MSSSSSPSDPVAALGDAWRHAREALRFSSVRGREVTETHVLRIGGYSTVGSMLPRGRCVESDPFRAGGHRWKLEYYPNGFKDSTGGGCATALLRLQDNRLLGRAADATAGYRVDILDGGGNAVYGSSAQPVEYRVRGRSGIWVDIKEAKPDALRSLTGEDGSLSVRCDVTVQTLEKESRVKCLLRGWLLQ